MADRAELVKMPHKFRGVYLTPVLVYLNLLEWLSTERHHHLSSGWGCYPSLAVQLPMLLWGTISQPGKPGAPGWLETRMITANATGATAGVGAANAARLISIHDVAPADYDS